MLTGKPAAQKPSSDLLDASMASTASRYIEEQQATQQVCVGGWGARGGRSLDMAQDPLLIAVPTPSICS